MWTNTDERTNPEGYDDPTAYEAIQNIASEETAKQYHRLVFICSPYAGDVTHNLCAARQYARFALDYGVIPVAPHLIYPQLLDDSDPTQRVIGLTCGLMLLRKCSGLWVFGGRVSNGMRLEIDFARKRGIPIRFFDSACGEVPPFA